MRELVEATAYDDEAWKEMCELGWAGIFIDEAHGGQELGTVELIILLEELGYALAPVPFFSNTAAGLAVQVAGSDEQRERWLPGLVSGELRGTVGVLKGGEARLVPDAAEADLIVLAGEDGAVVAERSAAEVEAFDALDATRRFGRVRADGGEETAARRRQPALDRICVALAAENVGVAQRAMEMAVDYARERKQFDRPIGSYQAVSHRCAQMLLEVEGSRSAAYYAAWCAAEPGARRSRRPPRWRSRTPRMPAGACAPPRSRSTAASASPGSTTCTSSSSVRVNALMFGSAAEHRERVASLSGLASDLSVA